VTTTLDEFDVNASSVARATFDYLVSLEWIAANENLCLVGPGPASPISSSPSDTTPSTPATGALLQRHRPGRDPLSRTGRRLRRPGDRADPQTDLILIDEIGFAPMDDNGAQLSFRIVAAAYERRSLGIASHWPFEDWGRFLPEHTTAVRLLDRGDG